MIEWEMIAIIAQGEGDFPFTLVTVGVHSSFSLQMIHLYTLMLCYAIASLSAETVLGRC